MKNNYEKRGATAVIFVNGGGYKNKEVLIDLCDLPRLQAYPNSWYILKSADHLYARSAITENGKIKRVLLHRFILDAPDDLDVDHKNHNGLDNRRSNLRVVTHSENLQNRKGAQQNNVTGKERGVCWDQFRKKWKAQVEVNKKKYFVGRFTDKKDAINTVKTARNKMMNYSS